MKCSGRPEETKIKMEEKNWVIRIFLPPRPEIQTETDFQGREKHRFILEMGSSGTKGRHCDLEEVKGLSSGVIICKIGSLIGTLQLKHICRISPVRVAAA